MLPLSSSVRRLVQGKLGPRCLRRVASRGPTAEAAAHAVFKGGGSPMRFVPRGRRHGAPRRHQRGTARLVSSCLPALCLFTSRVRWASAVFGVGSWQARARTKSVTFRVASSPGSGHISPNYSLKRTVEIVRSSV